MADDKHDEEEKLLNSDEELHNSEEGEGQEESESFLFRMNRLLNESFAERAPLREELARKAGEWGSEGRDLERRKVEAIERLLQLQR